jgi:GxxExxY protein
LALRRKISEMITNDELTESIIGCAIEVHRTLGPGLLESTYEECLALELTLAGNRFQRQAGLPLKYKSVNLANAYRCDFIVENQVIVEIKAIEMILKVHDAQLKTYLKLSGMKTGLLINFNSVPLKDGIHRHTRSTPF